MSEAPEGYDRVFENEPLFDSDGKHRSLRWMIRNEPDWTESRMRHGNKVIDELNVRLDQANAENQKLRAAREIVIGNGSVIIAPLEAKGEKCTGVLIRETNDKHGIGAEIDLGETWVPEDGDVVIWSYSVDSLRVLIEQSEKAAVVLCQALEPLDNQTGGES